MMEVFYAGWKECKMKDERNQKRVKGRCGNLGDKSLVEFFGGRRKGLSRFDTQNKHKHRRSNGTKGKRHQFQFGNELGGVVGSDWIDYGGGTPRSL